MVINQDEDVESLSIKKDELKSDAHGLWVKLKIPKEEGTDIGNINDEKIGFENKDIEMLKSKYSNDMKRVCHVCQKTFSSGKALGGHMRIHVQLANNKDLVFKKQLKAHHTIMFKKRKDSKEKVIDFVKKKHQSKNSTTTMSNSYGGSGNMMIKKPTCIICGKDFPSMKSLFGHMRCHPERDWRGIHPPSSTVKNSSSSSSLSDADSPKIDDDQMKVLASGEKKRSVDLTESLVGWPVTAKRGRKATAAASSSELSSSPEDDQLHDAVNYLMMLAKGDSLESGVTQRKNVGESKKAANSFREANRDSKLKRGIIDQSSVGISNHSLVVEHGNEQRGSNEVGKAVVVGSDFVRGESVNKFEDNQESNCISDDHDQMDSKSTGKVNGRGFVESSTNFKVPIKNKKKRKKMKLCDLKISKNANSPADHKVVEAKPVTLPHDKYRCNTCDKSFPTHQALGGHRSSHNKFNVILHNSVGEDNKRSVMFDKNFSTSQAVDEGHKISDGSGLVEAPSSQAPSSIETCGKVLEFDLNEVPPSEDDEAGFESELACSW